MRIIFRNLILACDWVLEKNNVLYFGVSSQIFYTDYIRYGGAYSDKHELFNKGYLRVNNLHKVTKDKMSHILELICSSMKELGVKGLS